MLVDYYAINPDAGATVYSFPANKTLTSQNWSTYRVLDDVIATGMYKSQIDKSISDAWVKFSGATLPTGFDQAWDFKDDFSSSINLTPSSVAEVINRTSSGGIIEAAQNENSSFLVPLTGDVDLTAMTLRFVVEDSKRADKLVIENGSITRTTNTFTVTIGTGVTAVRGTYDWSLWDITSGETLVAKGSVVVTRAARKDS